MKKAEAKAGVESIGDRRADVGWGDCDLGVSDGPLEIVLRRHDPIQAVGQEEDGGRIRSDQCKRDFEKGRTARKTKTN